MATILTVTSTPSTFTNGNWPLSTFNGGPAWRFTFTPTQSSTALAEAFYALFASNDNGGLWLVKSGGNVQVQLYNQSSGALVASSSTITYSASQAITVTINLAAGTNASSIVISGATTGNGTTNFTLGSNTFFTASTLGVGTYTSNNTFNFSGTISSVDNTVAAQNIDPSGIASGYASGTGSFEANAIAPNGIASAQAFGSATLEADVDLVPSGIASAYASGTAIISSGVPTIGDTGLTFQLFGAGSNPCRVSLVTTAGSLLLLGTGGKSSDVSTTPTDSQSQTWIQVGTTTDYPDYSGYGRATWFCRNNRTGSLNVDTFVTAFDEHTTSIIEIFGTRLYVQAFSHKNVANSGAASPITSNPVVTTGPALLIAHWWGAAPVGQNHVVSATGWTVLESYGTDNPNGYVQHYVLAKEAPVPGTYDITITQSPAQGYQLEVFAIQEATLGPAGIASSEALGSATVEGPTPLDATGIASAYASGSAVVDQYVGGTGIASAQAFGSAVVDRYVGGVGIISSEALGTGVLVTTIDGQAIASSEALGAAKLELVIGAAAIASSEAHGLGLIEIGINAPAIASSETFGAAGFDVAGSIAAPAIASSEAFGNGLIQLGLNATAIASSESFGAHHLARAIIGVGIAPASAFGAAIVAMEGISIISATGIPSAQEIGVHEVDQLGDVVETENVVDVVLTVRAGSGVTIGVASTIAGAVTLSPRFGTRRVTLGIKR